MPFIGAVKTLGINANKAVMLIAQTGALSFIKSEYW